MREKKIRVLEAKMYAASKKLKDMNNFNSTGQMLRCVKYFERLEKDIEIQKCYLEVE